MYASISNHLFNFIRFAFAFILVFVIFPYFIFSKEFRDKFENVLSRFIKMVFLIIILGYGLVITRLFEFLGIVFSLVVVFIYAYVKRHGLPELNKMGNSIQTFLYNLVDGYIHPKDLIKGASKKIKYKVNMLIKGVFGSVLNLGETILTAVTFIYSGYLRLYDVYFHAAPALSDGNVTLAWLKYAQNRSFFHDGIYPQGFHISLAVIQKFSGADPVYILKYAGPIDCLLIAAGLYFVLSRLTGRKGPGIVAAVLYGVLGQYLSSDWIRQAATNSQEFSFIFIVPVFYFLYKYLESLDRKYLVTAFAGVTVTGLVHTLAFGFTVYGVVVILFIAVLVDFKKYFKVSLKVIGLGIISGIITLIPIALGFAMGIELHSSSADFLTSQVANITMPSLKITDYIAVGSSVLLYMYTLFSRRKRRELLMEKCFSALGVFSFLLYYLGGYLTKSEMISVRVGDLWALVSPLCIGMGVYALGQVARGVKAVRIWEISVCLALCVFSFGYLKPVPIFPYKMQYDANIEQYLRIVQICRPTEWRIIGENEMYAIAYGQGFIDYVKDFLNENNPEDEKITYVDNGNRIEVKDQDVFIFTQKKIFRTDFSNLQEHYDIEEQEKLLIEDWIRRYSKTHDNISVFYEDDDIAVYRIHQPPTRDEVMNTIW